MNQKFIADAVTLPDEQLEHMGLTQNQYRNLLIDRDDRELRAPTIGSTAPDFFLERLSPAGRRTGQWVKLSDHQGWPVALLFGSYT